MLELQGRVRLPVDTSLSVFLNCPFDSKYEPTFDAIFFAIVCSGFIPRSALESGNVAQPRIERILSGLFSSKYSLHDLSRCRGEGDQQLARFNMPLELGMAMARRFHGEVAGEDAHEWCVLVPDGHLYQQFISDLAGFDPLKYDGDPASVVRKVVSWLVTRPEADPNVRPNHVLRNLPAFRSSKVQLLAEWGDQFPWWDLVQLATRHRPRESSPDHET